MNDILGQFPEILRFGAAGISAIVCLFAFLLFKQQVGRISRSKSILRAVVILIGISVVILSLVDVGLRERIRNEVGLLWNQPEKTIETLASGKNGIAIPSTEIHILPSTGDNFVVKSDDHGNFVFKGVPEKMRWMIAKRDIKPEAKPPEIWLLDPSKKGKSASSSPL